MNYESPHISALRDEISSVEKRCRQALAIDHGKVARRLGGIPHEPQSWFALLTGIPGAAATRTLCRHAADAARSGVCAPGELGRYGILQTCLATLPRLSSMPVHGSVLDEFCAVVRRVASQPHGWGENFEPGTDAFVELARIVTLQTLHAGQSSFDIMALPRTWLLRVHPRALPGVVREVAVGLGRLGPIVMPHLSYWRANPKLLLPRENDRAMWRIARTIEGRPEIRGLVAASWLYSVEVGEITPHLAWVRDFYLENGAYLVDMEVAPERMGFLIGSERRRRLYAEGKFKPRNTLVLWRRQDILAWSAQYAAMGDRPRSSGKARRASTPHWRFNVNKTVSSGQMTLLDCDRLITSRPRLYWFLVLLMPCAAWTAAAGAMFGLVGALPTMVAGILVIWLFQYYFLQ